MLLFKLGFLDVRLVDIVDILIVGFILYRLYSWMRGTIAGQIFVGFMLIIATSVLSRALDMKLLTEIVGTLSEIWVIGLVILFQPELRRILLMIGRNGVFSTLDRFDANNAVDEIVSAAEDLSLRRFGALVVITRSSDLSLSFETGVELNANLTKEMLVSIFNPRSPLHDGAVVVSGETIRSARVVLPLSAATRVNDQLLGTRHRAALGVSELADVFVVVVSEETGGLSYAHEGVLHTSQTIDAIRLALLGELEATVERRSHNPLRRLVDPLIKRIVHRYSADGRSAGGRSRRVRSRTTPPK